MQPKIGSVAQFSSETVLIRYKPLSSKDDAQLKLQVADGITKVLRCIGSTDEAKVEMSLSQINFNCIPVCQQVQETFYISNKHKKYFAYFSIDGDKLCEGFDIRPLNGRIGPEDKQKFEISFLSSVVTDIKQKKIPINIRGSKQLNLLVSVVTLVPRVEILEHIFDFGQITYGNKGELQMTLTNTSNIQAQVELDLVSNNENLQEKLDCLSILKDKSKNWPNVLEEVFETRMASSKGPNRKYLITVKPFKTYIFKLLFVPMKPQIYK